MGKRGGPEVAMTTMRKALTVAEATAAVDRPAYAVSVLEDGSVRLRFRAGMVVVPYVDGVYVPPAYSTEGVRYAAARLNAAVSS